MKIFGFKSGGGQKSKKVEKHLFSFLRPLAPEIWLCIAFAYMFVSLTMWIVARFSPFEWEIATSTKVKRVSRRVREYFVDDCECDHDTAAERQCCEDDIIEEFDQNCDHCASEYFHNYHSSYAADFHSCTEADDDCATDGDDERSIDEALLSCRQELQPLTKSNNEINQIDYDDGHFFDECTNESEIELTTFHNNFTLINSFWYTIGTLMAGSDLHPKVFMHEIFI